MFFFVFKLNRGRVRAFLRWMMIFNEGWSVIEVYIDKLMFCFLYVLVKIFLWEFFSKIIECWVIRGFNLNLDVFVFVNIRFGIVDVGFGLV